MSDRIRAPLVRDGAKPREARGPIVISQPVYLIEERTDRPLPELGHVQLYARKRGVDLDLCVVDEIGRAIPVVADGRIAVEKCERIEYVEGGEDLETLRSRLNDLIDGMRLAGLME